MDSPRRIFVILGHTAAITPDFTLNDLPGSAGRLDILCRCVTSALCLSHGIRTDVEVYLVLRDQVTVRFEGQSVKRLNPDERSTGALIKRALEALQEVPTASEQESTPGVFVSRSGLSFIVQELAAQGVSRVVLHETGSDIRVASIEEPLAFFLSDHQNFTSGEEMILEGCQRLSLGPAVLHADHCISIVHNELDRRAAQLLQ